MRADSSKAAGDVNSDFIGIGGAITGDGKFDVNVFDKGMKNGYSMSKDGTKGLEHPITVLYNSNPYSNPDFASLINSVKVMHYDNGIWSYTYDDMSAELDDLDNKKLSLKKLMLQLRPLPPAASAICTPLTKQQERSQSAFWVTTTLCMRICVRRKERASVKRFGRSISAASSRVTACS